MESLYRQLGINHALILRLKENITENIVLDLFSKLDNINNDETLFSVVIKYPETNMRKRRGRL